MKVFLLNSCFFFFCKGGSRASVERGLFNSPSQGLGVRYLKGPYNRHAEREGAVHGAEGSAKVFKRR